MICMRSVSIALHLHVGNLIFGIAKRSLINVIAFNFLFSEEE